MPFFLSCPPFPPPTTLLGSPPWMLPGSSDRSNGAEYGIGCLRSRRAFPRAINRRICLEVTGQNGHKDRDTIRFNISLGNPSSFRENIARIVFTTLKEVIAPGPSNLYNEACPITDTKQAKGSQMNELYLLKITGPHDVHPPRFIEFPSLEDARMSAKLHESYGFKCRVFVAVEEFERA